MKNINAILFLIFLGFHLPGGYAQKNSPLQNQQQCGTMPRLETKFEHDPALRARFTQQLETFNRVMTARKWARPQTSDGVPNANRPLAYTIPVVFHIVLTDPSIVTDEQIQAQLNVLNKSFSGTSTDSIGIPSYFKSIFGKSAIQFALAQRTPKNENTTGIDRVVTTKTSFSYINDPVKHSATGGADIWNGDNYLNVWVCVLGDNLLGYGTFPNDGQSADQGVVIDYRSMPGGSLTNFNGGKTLTHETGHYFNLYHIWGDDNGACTGTDFVDDTPNQGNSTTGCFSGIKTDNCTTAGNGILYEDYMDYSYDKCLLLFTTQQEDRMETALLTYRSSLLVSNALTPVVNKILDAKLFSIDAPAKRICTNTFSPFVTVGNRGSQTITSLVVSAVIDNAPPVNYTWSGLLTSVSSTAITLNPLTIPQGNHTLKIFVSSPNAGVDENNLNDTLTTTIQYFDPVAAINEGFEGNSFPPPGWDIVNPDQSVTWAKITGTAKTGSASVVMTNFGYTNTGQQDLLRLPELNLVSIDSAYLSFQLAANTFTATTTSNNNWDTLEVLASKDCGATYTSLYKKWGANLVTSTLQNTASFKPGPADWRKDSVNLTPYINGGKFMLAFRNTTANENNIYLDDISLRTQTINPNLKATGFLVTPNPASSNIRVQFYPNPVNLLGIQLYNLYGQKLVETSVPFGQGAIAYNFDMNWYPAGTYIVRAIFSDKILTKRIIKN